MCTKQVADIAIVAANFNNEPYLKDFFSAILESSIRVKELIFVDDGSSDNSLLIAEGFKEALPSLRILSLGANQGFARALNIGIGAANAKYIFRIDPDDVLGANQLERQLCHLERFNLDVVGANATIFQSETGRILGQTNFPLTHEDIVKRIRNGEHGVLHPTVLAKAWLFKKLPYEQKNVPAEDYDIFARFLSVGAKFGNLKEPLLSYRVHGKSASSSLRFSTIRKTYELRDQIFGTQTPKVKTVAYYIHIKAYRKHLMCVGFVSRTAWAIVSVCANPRKVTRRLRRIMQASGKQE
jgi:glycosyltransferase involved in cell wall biosynthesis